MWFGVITLFEEMFRALNSGITGRALEDKRIEIHTINPRDFSTDKHQRVDDRPYGGGPGMVMKAEPIAAAIDAAKHAAPASAKVVFLSPQGKPFNQAAAIALSQEPALILLAGRYEGVDERVIDTHIDEEWSIGDYILTGGELPAMVMIDCITRLLPGAVGDEDSVTQDSLSNGLLKYPQYTRPETALGIPVPEPLLNGHHQHISEWRLKMSLGRTWLKRPDLLNKLTLSLHEQRLLNEFIDELNKKM